MSNDTDTLQAQDQTTEMMRRAKLLSTSQFLPQHYRGKPDDCLVAIQWAHRTGRDPLELLQNTFVVHGTPGMKATYLIAQANERGPFDGPIRFSFEGAGDSLKVTAFAFIDGERYDRTISMADAKRAGWTKNDLYRSIPEQLLAYRCATFLIRLYCPEVMYGMQTVEELQDIAAAPREVQAEPSRLEQIAQGKELDEPVEAEVCTSDLEENTAIMRGDYDDTEGPLPFGNEPKGELFDNSEKAEDPA